MSRLQEIQKLIDAANDAYYTSGASIMEDAKYDALKLELEKLNPSDSRLTTVGASIRDGILQKKKHFIPMGSLNKALNHGELLDWVKNKLQKNGLNANTPLHASLKLDGGSFSLEYDDGKLVSAISRGDGFTGEDITANALKFKNLPKLANHKNIKFTGYIRGEVVLTNDDWLAVDPDQTSNPRNLAVGISRRKDGEQAEYLKFFGFRIFNLDGTVYSSTESAMSRLIEGFGFETSPYIVGTHDEVWKWYLEIQSKRSTLQYWIDGIVLKIEDINTQTNLGESSGNPIAQVALKFEAEGAIATLLEVNFQVGNTGALCPVATFTPVRIGGTTIENASLCNIVNIATLGLCIGDQIQVIKAGDIIPRIMEVTAKGINRKSIKTPTECPCCGGEVGTKANVHGDNSTAIYCINDACPAILTGKIERYLKSLDIQGIGISVIEALIKNFGVKTPADLYCLRLKEAQIADMELSGKTRMGEKRAAKILEEIDKKRDLTLSEFLGSLSIFGLGKRRVAIIQENTNGLMDDLEAWFDGTLQKHAGDAGVPNIAQRIADDLMDSQALIKSFIKNGVTIKSTVKKVIPKGAFTVCITGALNNPKKYYQKLIEDAGHIYTDTLSKDVTYLVAADPASGSSKMVKAIKNGTKVIGEDQLLKLLSTTPTLKG